MDQARETEAFHLWHRAKGSKHADWQAAWRLWVQRASQRPRAGTQGPPDEAAQLLGMAELLGVQRRTSETDGAYIARLREVNARRIARLA